MRKLVFVRKKSFVECLSRVYLYDECANSVDANMDIQGKPSVKDKTKNGKSLTFDIPDTETTVYLESSTMQTSFVVPAGSEDVELSAEPHYSPSNGNPFTISRTK